jgi:hypothetical protein
MTAFLSLDGKPSVSELSLALLILPLGYLVMSVIGRKVWTWPVVVAGIGLVVGLRVQTAVEPVTTLVGISLCVLVLGIIRETSRRNRDFRLQVMGLFIFTTLALLAMTVDPTTATWVVAAGWFGHGIWDLAHLLRKRVVSASFAEWCGVFDIGIAVQLILIH